MFLSPDSARRGQTLAVTVAGVVLHHVTPALGFNYAGASGVVPVGRGVRTVGRGRLVSPSCYEYDVEVEPNAVLGDYTAVLRGRRQPVGTFTVLEASTGAGISVSPVNGHQGQALVLRLSGFPLRPASRSPTLGFQHLGATAGSSPSPVGVQTLGQARWIATPTAGRPTRVGSYEYDVQIQANAPLGDYRVLLPGGNIAGTFTVLPAATGSVGASSLRPAGVAGTPPDLTRRVLEAEARIFEAEAGIFEAIARAAVDGARDPAWLSAAAQKQCASAHLIEALAEKERVLANTSSGPEAPSGNGGGNGGGGIDPRLPLIFGPREQESEFATTRTRAPAGLQTESQEKSFNDEGDADSVCKSPCTVILSNGEERFDRVDLWVLGRGGLDFELRRRYRSLLDYDGPMGFGWFFNYEEGLDVLPNGDVMRINGGSHIDTWTLNADGSYTAPQGHFRALLRQQDGTFVLRDADGFKRLYHADGFLARYIDRHGNEMRFEHDADGNLELVIDPYGRAIEFEYRALLNDRGELIDRLVTVRDFAGREVRYTYDNHGDLVEVRTPIVTGTSTQNDFPLGRTERNVYTSGEAYPELNHKLLSVTRPEEVASGGPPALAWTYGTDPNDPLTYAKVLTETRAGHNASGVSAGGTRSFAYERLSESVPLGNPDVVRGSVLVTEPNGNRTRHFGNENRDGILTYRYTRGLRGGEPTFYATRSFYDDDGQLVRRIYPEGNETRWKYDQSGVRSRQQNVIERRRIAGPRGSTLR